MMIRSHHHRFLFADKNLNQNDDQLIEDEFFFFFLTIH